MPVGHQGGYEASGRYRKLDCNWMSSRSSQETESFSKVLLLYKQALRRAGRVLRKSSPVESLSEQSMKNRGSCRKRTLVFAQVWCITFISLSPVLNHRRFQPASNDQSEIHYPRNHVPKHLKQLLPQLRNTRRSALAL